jgi:hypothetical protein
VVVSRQAEKASVKAAPKRGMLNKAFTARRFTIRHLWRTTLWGATAAAALLLAVLSTRSEVGSQRIAAVFSTRHGTQPFDAQAETRRLAAAMLDLAAQNGRLKSQLAAVEQNMDDITGSVTRQIQAVRAQTANPWPADANPLPSTPAEIASIVSPSAPAAVFGTSLPSPPQTLPVSPTGSQSEASAAARPDYGVEIGSALSIEVLRAHWLGIRSAHRELFEGLTPTVELHQAAKSKRIELRLVVGPLADADAAMRLCALLASYRLFCQPTTFDRQHVALQ